MNNINLLLPIKLLFMYIFSETEWYCELFQLL